MKVYLVQAGEWETSIRCVCATEQLAKDRCLDIAKEYEVEDDYEDMISYEEYEVEE